MYCLLYLMKSMLLICVIVFSDIHLNICVGYKREVYIIYSYYT